MLLWSLDVGPWNFGRWQLIRAVALLCAWAGVSVSALAHTADTSYARIAIEPNRAAFKLTYDVSTLLKVAVLDKNADGRISREEFFSGVGQIESYFRRHIFPEINSTEVELGDPQTPTWPADAGDAIAQKDYQQRLLSFVFHNHSAQPIEEVAITFDFFSELGDRHTVLGVFAHGKNEQEVIFNRLDPDYLYDVKVGPNGADQVFATTGGGNNNNNNSAQSFSSTVPGQMAAFIKLGVHHIFQGYDHLLFLFGLIVVSRFWDLVKIVTSFTVAHTITLILATLHVVNLSARFVEIAIALTIVYVAVENLWIKRAKNRWRLTFGFGLIHGFGFANVLQAMELPATGMIRSLLSFNVGVELGQLTVVLAALPLLYWISRRDWNARAQTAISVIILLIGCGWFVDRAFGLAMMPF